MRKKPRSSRQAGQLPGEAGHRLELLPVAPLAPEVVVAVLLAAGGVGPGGLDVAERVGADPDVLPGGRDGELTDAVDHGGFGDAVALLVEELEALASPPAPDAGAGAVDASQPCHGGTGARHAEGSILTTPSPL